MNTERKGANFTGPHETTSWPFLKFASVQDALRVHRCPSVVVLLLAFLAVGPAAKAGVELTVGVAKPGEAIDLTRYALGQGGLSDKPMFNSHVEQIAQLHPQTIRIFVQEFFNLYPKRRRYHWDTLDQVIETILATKAKPILCLCFKPN